MFFKNLWVLVIWKKVASALELLILVGIYSSCGPLQGGQLTNNALEENNRQHATIQDNNWKLAVLGTILW